MFKSRVHKLQEQILKEELGGVLISSVANIAYLSGFSNFSKEEREAYLFIGQNFAYIITDGRYTEAVKKEVPHLEIFERGQGRPTEDLFKKHKKQIKRLGIEEDNLTVSEHKILSKHFKSIKHFNINRFRSIKDTAEINKIETACKIGDLAFDYILKEIKVGISEREVANKLEDFIKHHNSGFSFPAIVAFGKNAAVPHHQTGGTTLKDQAGQFILLDFGVSFENYCSDMTRTIFFGKPTEKQKIIYKTVLEAQQKAINYINSVIKSGKNIKAAKVDRLARDYIVLQGYPIIPHSLGHGIGLEVHEQPFLSPKSKDILKEGMVFSVEPGIYMPSFGGVRVEDLFVIENKGLRQLTNSQIKLMTLNIQP